MTVRIDTSKPIVALTDREPPMYGESRIKVENNRLIVNTFMAYDSTWDILGIRWNDDKGGYDAVLLEFLKRCYGRGWEIKVLAKDGACAFSDGEFYSLKRLYISRISDMDFEKGSLVVTRSVHSRNDRQLFIQDSDILGFHITPRSLKFRGERVDIGGITLTRSHEKYHSYFVDIDLPDTRLLKDICDFTGDFTHNRGFKKLEPLIQLEGEYQRFIIKTPEEAAIALGLSGRYYDFNSASSYEKEFSDILRNIGIRSLDDFTSEHKILLSITSTGQMHAVRLDVLIQRLEEASEAYDEATTAKVIEGGIEVDE